MDLNYLFYRQQIERSMAEAASSEAARKIHEELAREYERLIVCATSAKKSDDAQSLFPGLPPRIDLAEARKLNETIAVAMTAREVAPAKV